MTQISFKAQYIRQMNVQKRSTNGTYNNASLSLVKFDIKNENDLKALYDITQNQDTKFLPDVYDDVLSSYKSKETKFANLLLLTEQKENFEKLEAGKICGYTDFIRQNQKSLQINYLETIRNNKFGIKNREYKGIGKAFLDFFKCFYNKNIKNINLYVFDEKVRKFYTDNGFIPSGSANSEFVWIKPKTLPKKILQLLKITH